MDRSSTVEPGTAGSISSDIESRLDGEPESSSPPCPGNYVVKPGDSISSIAAATGHFWETIWHHPANEQLRKKRTHPEILAPGDALTIPPRRPGNVSCATGRRHVFRRRGVPVRIYLQVRDREGNVFAGKTYELTIGKKVYRGQTDPDGKIQEWVAPAAKFAHLTVWLDEPGFPETYASTIGIGYMDPIETVSGIQARLKNLGFDCREEPSEFGPGTREALCHFQTHCGLDPTGEIDDTTRARLCAEHGS